jgi:hypothetical protein
MVSAPGGMRCADCTTHPATVTGARDTTDRIGWALALGLLIGIGGALMIKGLGFIAMAVAPCYGALVGDVLLRILGKSQKLPYLNALGLGSVAFGAMIVFANVLPNLSFTLMVLPRHTAEMVYGLSIGLALSACYGRLQKGLG